MDGMGGKQRSDEELMAAYVGGDRDAFGELFGRYAAMITRTMRRQIRQPEDCNELVQQTFLQLHRARRDFDLSRKLRPWLMTIAFNLRREYFRKRMRRPEAPLEVEPVAPADDRGDIIERKEDVAKLRSALAALPDGQREVIELHWFEHISFPEIAATMGLSVSAVKVRAHRGYKAMRAHLQRGNLATEAAYAASEDSP